MTASPTQDQVSAGGVAFRRRDDRIEVALISVGNAGRWQLPKGLVDGDEPTDSAAQREVREEAGLETELVGLIDDFDYWYHGSTPGGQRQRFHKHVYFYLLKAIGGDVCQHDHEVNEARWFMIDEAIEKLSFKSEKKVVEKSKAMLAERA